MKCLLLLCKTGATFPLESSLELKVYLFCTIPLKFERLLVLLQVEKLIIYNRCCEMFIAIVQNGGDVSFWICVRLEGMCFVHKLIKCWKAANVPSMI